jgi:hypothetical protein
MLMLAIARRTLRRAVMGRMWFRSAAGSQAKISHECICKSVMCFEAAERQNHDFLHVIQIL